MQFIKETIINATPEKVFEFHLRPDALKLLTPPWEKVSVIQLADITKIGSQAIIETKIFGLVPARWVAEHTKFDPPKMFEDIQVSGPFASWRHQHIIIPHANDAILRDEIDFEPPMWIFGKLAAPFAILPKLEKMFDYRHQVTKDYCEGTAKSEKD
jgi:ligand-binding SRPBCC domain-containing protein